MTYYVSPEERPQQIQPVDAYVMHQIRRIDAERRLGIDFGNLTRAERLKAAVAFADAGDRYTAAEIMTGRRIESSTEDSWVERLVMKEPFDDEWLMNFTHLYTPEEVLEPRTPISSTLLAEHGNNRPAGVSTHPKTSIDGPEAGRVSLTRDLHGPANPPPAH